MRFWWLIAEAVTHVSGSHLCLCGRPIRCCLSMLKQRESPPAGPDTTWLLKHRHLLMARIKTNSRPSASRKLAVSYVRATITQTGVNHPRRREIAHRVTPAANGSGAPSRGRGARAFSARRPRRAGARNLSLESGMALRYAGHRERRRRRWRRREGTSGCRIPPRRSPRPAVCRAV